MGVENTGLLDDPLALYDYVPLPWRESRRQIDKWPEIRRSEGVERMSVEDANWGPPREASTSRLQSRICNILQNRKTLAHVLSDLDEMRKEEDEPDFRHSPTNDAYSRTRQIIKNAYTHYVASAPVPAIAPDGDGGVIIEWRSERRLVRLVVLGEENQSSYVYSKMDGPSEVNDPATDLILAQRLRSTFAD